MGIKAKKQRYDEILQALFTILKKSAVLEGEYAGPTLTLVDTDIIFCKYFISCEYAQ